MGKTLIIANWKMNFTVHEASVFLHKLDKVVQNHRNVEMVIAPTALCLQPLSIQIDHAKYRLAAQNLYWRDEGAFTGEVSAHQLRGLVKYALIGHSERRYVFHEHEKDIRNKVQAAVRNGVIPVLCVGETAAERTDGETDMIIHNQIVSGLANLTADEAKTVVVAYEPVWAISKGKDFAGHASATPGDAAKAARSIRRQIQHLFGRETAQEVRVLYGGSVNGSNSAGFLTVTELDGLLVGGASLHVDEFSKMVKSAHDRR